jgi:argininosuccinate lyase
LSIDELRRFGDEFGEDFFEAITLNATLDCHDVVGGTARNRVRDAVQDVSRRIASDKASLASKKSAKLGLESAALV